MKESQLGSWAKSEKLVLHSIDEVEDQVKKLRASYASQLLEPCVSTALRCCSQLRELPSRGKNEAV